MKTTLKRGGWSRKDAIELLERQPCNCKALRQQCIRCELLVKLGADPKVKP